MPNQPLVGASAPLPSWLVIGAPRAGTTALAAWLGGLPELFVPLAKEVRYFSHDRLYERGADYYRSRFAGAAPGQLTGEATPRYLADSHVPARIATLLPDVRMIAIVREPVARAYSHHWYLRGLGYEHRSFEEAMAAERSVAGGDPAGLLAMGRYAEHLARYDRCFAPDQVLTLVFEELVADPAPSFEAACRHIGIAPRPPAVDPARRNEPFGLRWVGLQRFMVRHRAWSRLPWDLAGRIDQLNRRPLEVPPMDPALGAELRAEMREPNRALAERLGRPLPWPEP